MSGRQSVDYGGRTPSDRRGQGLAVLDYLHQRAEIKPGAILIISCVEDPFPAQVVLSQHIHWCRDENRNDPREYAESSHDRSCHR